MMVKFNAISLLLFVAVIIFSNRVFADPQLIVMELADQRLVPDRKAYVENSYNNNPHYKNNFRGSVIFTKFRQIISARDYYFRVEYADGKWHATHITAEEYGKRALEYAASHLLPEHLRNALFLVVLSGEYAVANAMQLGHAGGGVYRWRIQLTNFDCENRCSVTITDLPADESEPDREDPYTEWKRIAI